MKGEEPPEVTCTLDGLLSRRVLVGHGHVYSGWANPSYSRSPLPRTISHRTPGPQRKAGSSSLLKAVALTSWYLGARMALG